jgi:hypothetical protein
MFKSVSIKMLIFKSIFIFQFNVIGPVSAEDGSTSIKNHELLEIDANVYKKELLNVLPPCRGSPIVVKMFDITKEQRELEEEKGQISSTWTKCHGEKIVEDWWGYKGGWLNGEPHFYGTTWNADGEVYVGGFRNGKRHDFGFEQKQGSFFREGIFRDGQFIEKPWWKFW